MNPYDWEAAGDFPGGLLNVVEDWELEESANQGRVHCIFCGFRLNDEFFDHTNCTGGIA